MNENVRQPSPDPMNFSTADAVDEAVLNQAIWESVKGASSVMPSSPDTTGSSNGSDG